MKTSKLRTRLVTTAAGAVLAMGVGSFAFAAPVFTVDPSVLTGPAGTFQADFISGISSELLTSNPITETHSGSGWVQFTSFSLLGAPVSPLVSGLLTDYQLYLTFDLTDTLASGTFNAPGSINTLTSLNFQVWGDPDSDATFTQANAGTATNATVNVGTADILIGSGSLITGTAGFDSLGGAFLNSIENYLNTLFGDTYFVSPSPFFTVAFDEFNNTTQGIQVSGNLISINQATGGVDFQQVPEPSTLALLGIALAGVGFFGSRGKKPFIG